MIQFTVESSITKRLGKLLKTYDHNKQLVCYAKTGFKTNRHLEFFTDETKTQLLFTARANYTNRISIASTVVSVDIIAADGILLAKLRKERANTPYSYQQWHVINSDRRIIARINENSNPLKIFNSYNMATDLLFPQTFSVIVSDKTIATYTRGAGTLIMSRLDCKYSGIGHQPITGILMYAIPNVLFRN